MSNLATTRDMLFVGMDLRRDRWAVEQEKVRAKFPGFRFYAARSGQIVSVKGNLYTSYGNTYLVKIVIPQRYPYEMPAVSLVNHTLEPDCPHKFLSGNICLMKSEQWSTVMSIALIIAKTAKWLHKYDYWKRHGTWPGREQEH
jgi:hypothetical protein